LLPSFNKLFHSRRRPKFIFFFFRFCAHFGIGEKFFFRKKPINLYDPKKPINSFAFVYVILCNQHFKPVCVTKGRDLGPRKKISYRDLFQSINPRRKNFTRNRLILNLFYRYRYVLMLFLIKSSFCRSLTTEIQFPITLQILVINFVPLQLIFRHH